MPLNPQETVEAVVADQLKPEADIPYFSVGDTLNVHVRIIEGDKERIQVFQGVLIAQKGRGINRTITVRRIVANEGVERIFPLHSPRIAAVEVVRRGDARRAKLYYLRGRVGKGRRLRDQRRGLKHVKDWEERQIKARKGRVKKQSKPEEAEK
ncbi:MAG: 50S ribosomal protein L19 [Phycisphaerales bacterium]|nr:MAG: 50S ribosomal protein L19 [Phycisphaerales bacterium]